MALNRITSKLLRHGREVLSDWLEVLSSKVEELRTRFHNYTNDDATGTTLLTRAFRIGTPESYSAREDNREALLTAETFKGGGAKYGWAINTVSGNWDFVMFDPLTDNINQVLWWINHPKNVNEDEAHFVHTAKVFMDDALTVQATAPGVFFYTPLSMMWGSTIFSMSKDSSATITHPLRMILTGRGANEDPRGFFADFYLEELVGSTTRCNIRINGYGLNRLFSFNQDGVGYSEGGWRQFSDERRKYAIEEVPDALEAVLSWRGATWINEKDDSRSFGYIAQDLEATDSRLVTPFRTGEGEDHLSVDYSGISAAYHTEAIKSLHRMIMELKEELVSVRSELSVAKEELSVLQGLPEDRPTIH